MNQYLQMDLTVLVWALIDKNSPASTFYYFSVFNLNNWYSQCMPSKMRPLYELNVDGSNRFRRNVYFLNYSLSLNCELESLKFIATIDSEIDKMKNQNLLSQTNNLKKLIKSDMEEETLDHDEFNFSVNDLNLNDENCLSMNFGKKRYKQKSKI